MNIKLNNKKFGISLIVLVITIIVMIILAASIILSLQSSGIIGKANEAKTANDNASAKQIVTMAKAEWQLDEEKIKSENSNIKNFSDYAEIKLNESGINAGSEKQGSYIVTSDEKIYKYPLIPEGFKLSEIENEQSLEDGLVIYEIPTGTSVDWEATSNGDMTLLDVQEEYNQYVWIPVPDIKEFVLRDGYYNGKIDKVVSNKYVTEPSSYNGNTSYQYPTEVKEYNAMYASVKKYGGFYIGRYEASKEGTDTAISKRGKTIWTGMPWGKSMKEIGTEGAVYYAQKAYKDSKQIASTLCYGVQWDTMLKFVEDDKHDIHDSDLWGNYKNTGKDVGTAGEYRGSLQTSGKNEAWKAKNIYDIAGNATEWSMEAAKSTNRCIRGGNFAYVSWVLPASSRWDYSPDSKLSGSTGFRVALYIK